VPIFLFPRNFDRHLHDSRSCSEVHTNLLRLEARLLARARAGDGGWRRRGRPGRRRVRARIVGVSARRCAGALREHHARAAWHVRMLGRPRGRVSRGGVGAVVKEERGGPSGRLLTCRKRHHADTATDRAAADVCAASRRSKKCGSSRGSAGESTRGDAVSTRRASAAAGRLTRALMSAGWQAQEQGGLGRFAALPRAGAAEQPAGADAAAERAAAPV
jgi:hypothetical protein